MERYGKAIEEMLKVKLEGGKENDLQTIHFSANEILSSIKLDHKSISERECEDIAQSKTKKLIDKILNHNNEEMNNLLKEILEILYLKDSPMMNIVYQSFPTILRKCIENQDSKNSGTAKIT